MSVGGHLDDCAHLLRQAAGHLTATPDLGRYGLAAAIRARDRLYQELTRFLLVLRVPAPGRELNLQDAILLLGEDSGGTVERQTVLATGLKAAALGLPDVAAELLHAPGSVAALVAHAAEAVGIATEIIATHVHPAASSMPWNHNLRYVTREGAALIRGAQRDEVVGEVARLTLAAVAVDWQLVAMRWFQPDVLAPQQWELIAQWANSSYPPVLAQLATAPPAGLLRQLPTAPVVERSSGPRQVGSWRDAIAAVTAARSEVRRAPGRATLAMARAAARLGFAANAASWRVAATVEPTPRLAAHADRWRELAAALSLVSDVRDNIEAPLVAELNLAKAWIREQAKHGALSTAVAGDVARIQQEVGLLCRDIHEPLRIATSRGELLSVQQTKLGSQPVGGIVRVDRRFARAGPKDRMVEQMLHALATASALPVSSPAPDTVRREPSRASSARELTDQVALDAGLLALSRAWPETVRRSLHNRGHPAAGRESPAEVHQDRAGREELQQ